MHYSSSAAGGDLKLYSIQWNGLHDTTWGSHVDYTHTHTHTHTYTHTHTHVCVCTCTCTHTCIHMYVWHWFYEQKVSFMADAAGKTTSYPNVDKLDTAQHVANKSSVVTWVVSNSLLKRSNVHTATHSTRVTTLLHVSSNLIATIINVLLWSHQFITVLSNKLHVCKQSCWHVHSNMLPWLVMCC